MKKNIYTNLFTYLKAFCEINLKQVQDIEKVPDDFKIIWWQDFQNQDRIEHLLQPEFNPDNEYWLRIKKPQEPLKPAFPDLPAILEPWVDKMLLTPDAHEKALRNIIQKDEKTLMLEDYPNVRAAFDEYINEKWEEDSLKHEQRMMEYYLLLDDYKKVQQVYQGLFSISNKLIGAEENYELVVAVGLLNFKASPETDRIFRHIVTHKVNIQFNFEEKDSFLTITPAPSANLTLELDVLHAHTEFFDPNNLAEVEKNVKSYLESKKLEDPLVDIEDALKLFAERFYSDGRYQHKLERPGNTPSSPSITFSPALILRKRDQKVLPAAYEAILNLIENSGDALDIPIINDMLELDSAFTGLQPGDGFGDHSWNLPPDNIPLQHLSEPYFPKEFNEEQKKIADRIRYANKVLVQGPPGTGKSHTIANLICHLLAHGKNVLVTAKSKRALEVLKDKLPPNFQKLAINLLSNDQASLKDTEASISEIFTVVNNADLQVYQEDVEKLEQQLHEKRAAIAKTTNELIDIREKTTRDHEFNDHYRGKWTEVAEKLKMDGLRFAWYQDAYHNLNHDHLLKKVEAFIRQYQHFEPLDVSSFDERVPDPSQLPPPSLLQELTELQRSTRQLSLPADTGRITSTKSFASLLQQLDDLQGLYNRIERAHSIYASDIRNAFLQGNPDAWEQKLMWSEKVLNRLAKQELEQFDQHVEVSLPSEKSWKQLKSDAQKLLDWLLAGNALEGWSFKMKRVFLPVEIKERLYFTKEVRVNGSSCTTVDEFKVVLFYLALLQDFEECAEIWDGPPPWGQSFSKKVAFFQKTDEDARTLFDLLQKAKAAIIDFESHCSITLGLLDHAKLKEAMQLVTFSKNHARITQINGQLDQAVTYLKRETTHPIGKAIIESLEKENPTAYDSLLQQLKTLRQKIEAYQIFKKLQEEVAACLPGIVRAVRAKTVTVSDVPALKDAIYYRHAQQELLKRMDKNRESNLALELARMEKEEKELIAEVAAKRAWVAVLSNLKKNQGLLKHLRSWQGAISKVGKTGKGKRARKYLKVARESMENSKGAVPCWIMPFSKVVETISPTLGMFDVVIVDEASQLGVEAFILLFLAKKIIVVGDDKQTSPENVGSDMEKLERHIQKYLADIPYKDHYGLDSSFFDLVGLHCQEQVVLREHFRCMPEIIEFSNRHFYKPSGKGLYPLKQYSQNRLQPLVTCYCPDGYTEGKGERIVNKPEVKTVVDRICDLLKDERYRGKTFGVINMQGKRQSVEIEKMLLKSVGEEEFRRRKIICGNSASFQGDERDIMMLSLVTANNHNRQSFTNQAAEQRFNVAVSRAKEQVWLFHSVQLDDLTNTEDLRYKLLDHFKNYRQVLKVRTDRVPRGLNTPPPKPFDSWFEVDVYNDVVEKGISVIPQFEVSGFRYRIDLVALLPEGVQIAIECDGDKWHGPDRFRQDIQRQKMLERAGWQFVRIRGYEYYTNREKALEPLWEKIVPFQEKLPAQEMKSR